MDDRRFAAKQINDLLAIAGPQLKAMILLGINCGFGNRDCATLPIDQLDLATGWHTYRRPQTGTPRRAPLWPETAAALSAVIKDRTNGCAFITRTGKPWYSDDKLRCPITYKFRKLLRTLNCYETGITTFYSLRRTFHALGESAGEPKALQFMVGHTPAIRRLPSEALGFVVLEGVGNCSSLAVQHRSSGRLTTRNRRQVGGVCTARTDRPCRKSSKSSRRMTNRGRADLLTLIARSLPHSMKARGLSGLTVSR